MVFLSYEKPYQMLDLFEKKSKVNNLGFKVMNNKNRDLERIIV
jgi:hypothetical protein